MPLRRLTPEERSRLPPPVGRERPLGRFLVLSGDDTPGGGWDAGYRADFGEQEVAERHATEIVGDDSREDDIHLWAEVVDTVLRRVVFKIVREE